MPHLIIDDIAVDVPEGTTVIEAAEQAGIMIPRFCYLKALGSVGACRMCAVSFLAGPVKGIAMSCMVKVADGMVVSTTSEESATFRRQVIEWLMVNHPHDCPVCDEGGQCLLQDETVSGGHGIRRFPGKKRTYPDQDLGPFIQHEMNRCIHCYRCVRFYQEYAGYRDFGVMRLGNRTYYGRFEDGALESPFSGNLADICPTGVFTDKTARYRARRWDMQRAASLCIHCGLGCNTTANAYHQAIVRQEARENEAVNGSFICDRGRFGCFYANHDDRPRRPRLDGQEVSWQEALDAAVARLARIIKASGPGGVAVLGSARASLETLAMLQRWSRMLTRREPSYFVDPGLEHKITRAAARLDERSAVSLGEVGNADFIVVAGTDPLLEAPMLAMALRQAVRKGAVVVVVDPRPVSLPFAFTHLPTSPGGVEARLAMLAGLGIDRETVENLDPALLVFLDTLQALAKTDPESAGQMTIPAEQLKTCRRPLLVCGTEVVRETTPDFVADLALLLRSVHGECGLFYLFPEANAHGAALFSGANRSSFPDILEALEECGIKAVIMVETDPLSHCPDRRRLELALDKAELVVNLDYLPTASSARAHIQLPAATHFEAGAHFINQEGRIQFAQPVQTSARPLSQTGGPGGHPPRCYLENYVEYDPKPAWQVIGTLMAAMATEAGPISTPSHLLELIAEEAPALALVRQHRYPVDGVRIVPAHNSGPSRFITAGPILETKGDEALEVVLTDWTFGTEALSSYSEPLQQATGKPVLTMQTEDASMAGLSDGDTVKLHLDSGILEIPLRLSATMARGVVVLPRHGRLDWQQLRSFHETLPTCRIEKV